MDSEKKPRKKIDAKKAARSFYREGKTLKQSLMDGGLTETQAKKGRAILSEKAHLMKAFKAEHKKQIAKLQLLGQAMNNEELESFTLGTLVDVAANGKSKGSERVAAASWLGKSKKLNLFAPDQAIGIYNLQIPAEWQDRYLTTPTIDAIEVNAVAPESLEGLPKTPDGFITLNSFQPRLFENLPRKLESGKITVPTTMPTTEPEPIPATVPSPETERQYDIEVITQHGGKRQ